MNSIESDQHFMFSSWNNHQEQLIKKRKKEVVETSVLVIDNYRYRGAFFYMSEVKN
jgi:hypothetical protein